MKRRYNKKFYYDRIQLIRNKIPHISIGVDVIVGFPTETDKDFDATYELLKELEVSYLHVFPYSERDNTEGINIKPEVPQSIRNERSKKLRKLSDILKSEFLIKNMAKNHSVLVEGVDSDDVHGYTENYIKVRIDNKGININQLVEIKPILKSNNYITGERIWLVIPL